MTERCQLDVEYKALCDRLALAYANNEWANAALLLAELKTRLSQAQWGY